MIYTTLVTGAKPVRREAAIAAAIISRLSVDAPDIGRRPSGMTPNHETGAAQPIAVLLQGFPSGKESAPLAAIARSHPLQPLRIVRIAAGCLCCTGNLTMRVMLNRLLREQPSAVHLFIDTDSSDHLPALRAMLQAAPYADWLTLTADLEAG